MKTKIIAIALACVFVLVSYEICFAQDEQKLKDALIISTIKIQELEKQNIELKSIIQRVSEDLKSIKTMAQLDSLKRVYGIAEINKR